jgi:hypothetical protein
MTFTETTDREVIEQIVKHPFIYSFMGDDNRPPKEQWEPLFGDRVKYVVVRDGEQILGMFLLVLHTATKWEAHTLLLPEGRGRRAVKAYKQGIEWCRANGCRYLFGIIPEDNEGALGIALMGGMDPVGTFKKAVLRGGVMRDECIVGKRLL